MKKALFNVQLNQIERILEKLSLLKNRNKFPKYDGFIKGDFRNIIYEYVWEQIYKEKYYDFMLQDYSLISFTAWHNRDARILELSYSFYECPYLMQGDSNLSEHADWEAALQKDCVVPIRYDYRPRDYREGIHPASHLHLGDDSNVRIQTERILKPISFILFIIRQYYPDSWVDFHNMKNGAIYARNIRDSLEKVPSDFFLEKDKWELVLM